MNTGKRYRYRRSVQIQENNIILKNSISKISKFSQLSIKELIKLSSRQASKQASEHSIEAKQCWGQGQRTQFNH